MSDKEKVRPIEFVRELYRDKGLDAIWKWAMAPKGVHAKAKRFAILERFAEINRDRATDAQEREAWADRRRKYAAKRDEYEKRYRERKRRKEETLPDKIDVAELLYHNPPHMHIACPNRDVLIRVCKVAQARGLRVGEFPPFDPVENVHVSGSWHYRDSSSPSTPRQFANRGNGLAADLNDLDGGNDQEYAFYIEVKRRAV